MKYELIKFLLSWKKQGTPELHTSEYLPVFINPALTPAKIGGGLLNG
jgi:hypothetical protein